MTLKGGWMGGWVGYGLKLEKITFKYENTNREMFNKWCVQENNHKAK